MTDPTKLATYDATSKDSALFDDMTTPAVETKDERTVRALLDAIDLVKKALGPDDAAWRWGKMHTLTFGSLVPFWTWLSIPPSTDATFAAGFPRHGEPWTVDVGDYGDWLDPKASPFSFAYTNGPVQRLVVELDPAAGPLAKNALPGGAVWDDKSPHFRDEAELWRRNQNHPVARKHDDIVNGADEHVVYGP
jgi:penicillin amidase